jgi:hypothetical protein
MPSVSIFRVAFKTRLCLHQYPKEETGPRKVQFIVSVDFYRQAGHRYPIRAATVETSNLQALPAPDSLEWPLFADSPN